jgi:hypothetical protein
MHKIVADIGETPLKKIKVRNAIYPVIIGLGVVGLYFIKSLILMHLMLSLLPNGPYSG